MGSPCFSDWQFCHPWRAYQQRLLDAVDSHLADERLHIVAAPGSGKTSLGLETIRRLGRPALVLSPTRTIRDQWLARLADFVAGPSPGWASRDLDAPGLLTSITYQALHALDRVDDAAPDEGDTVLDEQLSARSRDAVAARLREAGIGTLVLDEAHHLRSAWWQALSGVVERVPGLVVVSLTATPPYEAGGRDWKRYQGLCGPIDAEIAVPELVKTGTLCPHQDFVWTVAATDAERAVVRDYDAAVDRLCTSLHADARFRAVLRGHPWAGPAEVAVEDALETPEAFVALLIMLRSFGDEIGKDRLDALGVSANELPDLSLRWWQVLLLAMLYNARFAFDKTTRDYGAALARRLRDANLLWRRELRLQASRPVRNVLRLSAAKVEACAEVWRIEHQRRGESLRQVVLTDYIRDEDADLLAQSKVLPTLGAWPVFVALARSLPADALPALAMLSGRRTVLHTSLLPALREQVRRAERAGSSLRGEFGVTVLPLVPGFLAIGASGSALVGPVTALLAAGEVRTLVGTRALLGEGWNAPAINSLVLASVVGSYMLTNQMRGRALRADAARPDKVSSIWHLLCVSESDRGGDADVFELERRFATFVGLGEAKAEISSGLARLDLGDLHVRAADDLATAVTARHARTMQSFARLDGLAARWREAIDAGDAAQVVPTTRGPRPQSLEQGYGALTLGLVVTELGVIAVALFADALGLFLPLEGVAAALAVQIAAGITALLCLPKLFRAARMWLRHLPVDGSVRGVALALRAALIERGHLQPNAQGELPVLRTAVTPDGLVDTSLAGGTFHEHSLFADSMAELLEPIENPRYLLVRRARRWLGAKADYHAVPSVLAKKADDAHALLVHWKRHVGRCQLVYARTAEGRQLLLRARARAFSARGNTSVARQDRWQ